MNTIKENIINTINTESSISFNTKLLYKQSIILFYKCFEDKEVYPNKETYELFAKYLSNRNYIISTFSTILYSLYSVFILYYNKIKDTNYSYTESLIIINILVHSYSQNKEFNNRITNLAKPISDSNLDKIINYLSKSIDIKDKRMLLFLLTAKYTGLRTLDILKLKKDNITFMHDSIKIQTIEQKTKRSFEVTINDKNYIQLLKLYIELLKINKADYLFPSIRGNKILWFRDNLYHHFYKILIILNIEKTNITIISFRKRLATLLFSCKDGISKVLKHFGWRSKSMIHYIILDLELYKPSTLFSKLE